MTKEKDRDEPRPETGKIEAKNSSEGEKAPEPGKSEGGDPDKAERKETAESAGIEPKTVSAPWTGVGVMATIVVLLVLGAIAGGAWATTPFWLPGLMSRIDPSPDPRLRGLEDKVAALETELRKVRNAPAGGDVLADLQARGLAFRKDVAAMVEKVTDLEDRLAAARAMAKATTLPGKVGGGETSGPSNRSTVPGTNAKTLDELARRISKLEAEGRNLREKANSGAEGIANVVKDLEGRLGRVEQRDRSGIENQAMVLMIERLRTALESHDPYLSELQSLKAVSPDTPAVAEALKILRASAASGVPTLGDMTRDFRETSGAIIAADRELPGGGWIRSALNRLSGLATIRNTDPNAAKGTDRIVALAERALNGGDLNAAAEALAKLTGKPAEAAKPWLAGADRRARVERALATLHAHAVARLAPSRSKTDGKE